MINKNGHNFLIPKRARWSWYHFTSLLQSLHYAALVYLEIRSACLSLEYWDQSISHHAWLRFIYLQLNKFNLCETILVIEL